MQKLNPSHIGGRQVLSPQVQPCLLFHRLNRKTLSESLSLLVTVIFILSKNSLDNSQSPILFLEVSIIIIIIIIIINGSGKPQYVGKYHLGIDQFCTNMTQKPAIQYLACCWHGSCHLCCRVHSLCLMSNCRYSWAHCHIFGFLFPKINKLFCKHCCSLYWEATH